MTYVKTVLKKEIVIDSIVTTTILNIPKIFLFPVKHITSGNSYM